MQGSRSRSIALVACAAAWVACGSGDDDAASRVLPGAGATGSESGARADASTGAAGTKAGASGSGSAGTQAIRPDAGGADRDAATGTNQRDASAAGDAAVRGGGDAGPPITGPPGTRLWQVLYDGGDFDYPGALAIAADGHAVINFSSAGLPTLTAAGEPQPTRSLLQGYDVAGKLTREGEGAGVVGFAASGELVLLTSDSDAGAYWLSFSRRDARLLETFSQAVGKDKAWGGLSNLYAAPALDGGAFACMSEGTNSLHVVSIGPNGELRFDVKRPETSGLLARVAARPGGGAVFATSRSPGAGNQDAWVVALDAAGQQQWEWSLDLGAQDVSQALTVDADGNTYVLGALYNDHLWLRKLDPNGDEQWDTTLGATKAGGASVTTDLEGNAIALWSDQPTSDGLWVAHLGGYQPDGTKLFDTLETARGTDVFGTQVAITPDGAALVLGAKDLGRGAQRDVWLARYAL